MDKFLIESIEHGCGPMKTWWRPNRLGYTEDINEAGRYSEQEAREICEKAGPENERMWSEEEVLTGKAGKIQKTVTVWDVP